MLGGGVIRRRALLSAAVIVATGAVLAIGAVSAGGATAPVLSLGGAFTVGSDGPGVTALGSDGTSWLATAAVAITARSLSGRTLGPVEVTGMSGFTSGQPVVAVSGATATFAWLVDKADKAGWTVEVRTVRCDIRHCEPVMTASSWQQQSPYPMPVWVGAYGLPGIASVGGHTVVAFDRRTGGRVQMMWTQSTGSGRWAAPQAINAPAPAGGMSAYMGDPVLVPESGGRVLAVWEQDPNESTFDLGWAVWTASAGFATTGTIAGGKGTDTALVPVVAAVGNGAAVAWIQGNNATDSFQEAEPVWLARQTATGLTAPSEIFSGDAAGLSLAGGGGVLALAFNQITPGFDADHGGPATVIRSVDGAPFTAPVQLAPAGAPSPAVSVDTSGNTIAVWYRELPGTAQRNQTQAAIASQHGSFSAPRTLGPGSRGATLGGEPTSTTVNHRTLITWLNTAETTEYGALATP